MTLSKNVLLPLSWQIYPEYGGRIRIRNIDTSLPKCITLQTKCRDVICRGCTDHLSITDYFSLPFLPVLTDFHVYHVYILFYEVPSKN
jgi:hypothetical protein